MRSRHERAASAPAVFPVERLELTFEPRPWPYAGEKRAEIDAFFAELQRKVPSVWNGRVLLLHRHVIADGVFTRRLSGNRLCELRRLARLGPAAGGRA